MAGKKWESYEQVAQYLLDQFAAEFGLERVEGKQSVVGLRSGTAWEIDGKGIREGNTGFLIVECRRYTTSKQNQGKAGSLAYSIIDSGAEGGIIVSPLGFQVGAQKVAAAENIIPVKLNAGCSRYEYLMTFLNKVMVGLHDKLDVTDELIVKVYHRVNGELVAEDMKLTQSGE